MKVQLPIMGRASGSSAGMIYQSYYGNTYARSFPLLFHYPDTKKQQDCQARFFDIQRVWLPIYLNISKNIKHAQRRDTNPFNKLTSYVYHIFNPYQEKKYNKLAQNWGLDRYNRVRPNTTDAEITINPSKIALSFQMLAPTVNLHVTPNETHVLLFNLNTQNMYYTNIPLQIAANTIVLSNTNKWEPGDKVAAYIALSAPSWLGNFNLIAL